MRVRSTGLGKTEMIAGIKRLEPVENGYIIMEMHSSEPIKWRIRIALTGPDLRQLIKLLFKPATALRLLITLFQGANTKPPPEF